MKRLYFLSILIGFVCVSPALGQNLVTNPTFSTGDLSGWSVALFLPGWGNGPENFKYDSAILALEDPVDGHCAKTEWSGHNEGRHCSIYQTLTVEPGVEYIISVQGQVHTNNQGSSVELRAVDGTGDWTQASRPGVLLDSMNNDVWTWTEMTGSFTPSGTTMQIGFSWVAGGTGAPWAICIGACDNWSVTATIAPVPPSSVDDTWETFR